MTEIHNNNNNVAGNNVTNNNNNNNNGSPDCIIYYKLKANGKVSNIALEKENEELLIDTKVADAKGTPMKVSPQLPTCLPAAARSILTNRRLSPAPLAKIVIDDLTERPRKWRVPWLTIILSIVQINVYAIANECLSERLMFAPTHRGDYWRYWSYMLLHGNLTHLLLNVVLQCAVGYWLESEQGRWRVAAIYALGGVSGSLGAWLLQPALSLIGASAAVYAMLLSHVPHLWKNFLHLPHRYLRIFALLVLCLTDALYTAIHWRGHDSANAPISYEAHLAGALSGLLGGWLIYRRVGKAPSEGGCCRR